MITINRKETQMEKMESFILTQRQKDLLVDALNWYDFIVGVNETKEEIHKLIDILKPDYYRHGGFYRNDL